MTSRISRHPAGAKFAGVVLTILLALISPARGQAEEPATSQAGTAGPATPRSDIEKQPINRRPAPGSATENAGTPRSDAAPGGTSGLDAGRVVAALGVVVVLIFLLRWVARRFFGVAVLGPASRAVQVISRSPLSPRSQLVLLRVGKRLIVVADGGGQTNTLSEITDPDEVAALLGQLQAEPGERVRKSFGSLFGRMRGAYAADTDADTEDDTDTEAGAVMETVSENSPEAQADRFDAGADETDAAVISTRRELSGLMDKVRLLSRQFKNP